MPHAVPPLRAGHHLHLLEGSRAFFPALIAAIDAAVREVPRTAPLIVAGDLNDWGAKLRPAMNKLGLQDFAGERAVTYPSRQPITQLDFVYARGMKPAAVHVPRGRIWWRMSDHLPLIAEFKL